MNSKGQFNTVMAIVAIFFGLVILAIFRPLLQGVIDTTIPLLEDPEALLLSLAIFIFVISILIRGYHQARGRSVESYGY